MSQAVLPSTFYSMRYVVDHHQRLSFSLLVTLAPVNAGDRKLPPSIFIVQSVDDIQGVVFSLVIVRIGLGISSENNEGTKQSIILSGNHGVSSSRSHHMTVIITRETRDDATHAQKNSQEPWETDYGAKNRAAKPYSVGRSYARRFCTRLIFSPSSILRSDDLLTCI